MIELRDYQEALRAQAYDAWADGHQNVMVQLPTGGGKTVIFSRIMAEEPGSSIGIAHRRELVGQMSLALARNGVRHRVLCPADTLRSIQAQHVENLGRSYVDPHARTGVAGIDTLLRIEDDATHRWLRSVRRWVMDEGHHVLKANKWGRGIEMLPADARGLLVTATPKRADGKGLGRASDGLADILLQGPCPRDLITEGYLTDYRLVQISSDVDYGGVPITATGEYSHARLCEAVHASGKIVGDVVREYKQRADGKLGITFAVDVEEAGKLAREFRAQGVPAEVVTADTPGFVRAQIIRRFACREIMQLVNVDLFGEGFDLPALEVVSMARKTASLSLFMQQFGRSLRVMVNDELQKRWRWFSPAERRHWIAQSIKPTALIIDHVGNCAFHGLPDASGRVWSLEPRSSRQSRVAVDVMPVRTCANPDANGSGIPCAAVYERVYQACPYCGFVPVPAARTVEAVDGVMAEMSPEVLAILRGDIAKADAPVTPIPGLSMVANAGRIKQHHLAVEMRQKLREVMALWGGWCAQNGHSVEEQQARFYHTFGVDVLSAQALNRTDSLTLARRILQQLAVDRVDTSAYAELLIDPKEH